MKTNYHKTIILIPLLTLACLLVLPATAQVNYAVSGGAAYVTSSPNASGDIVIASTYNGYPVTRIDPVAFANCSSLTSVTIPKDITNIGTQAFTPCFSLTSIAVHAANPAYSSLNGVLFNKAQTTLIQCPGGRGGSYVIPNSVTNIVAWAFFNCHNLTSVTIPNAVTSIADSTFMACYNLTNATIPNSVTNIGLSAFLSCHRLTSMTIPNGLISLGVSAFQYCHGLTSVTIPNSVTSIGGWAFGGCWGLTNITVAAANPVCTSLDGVLFNKAQTALVQFPAGRGGSYVIPITVTRIVGSAFSDCPSLTSVTIPNSVTNIGASAFSDCPRLTNVTIPDSVTTIGEQAFLNCDSLVNVTIPNRVTSIAYGVFFGCGSLMSVTIPNSVTTIGGSAFSRCTSLTSVTIPASVTTIGSSAFSYCTNLLSVTIPDRVTTIGATAFVSCSNLLSVTIGNSVTNIGSGAFRFCASLTNLTFLGNAPSLGDAFLTFYRVGAGATVYYYYGTAGWASTYGGLPTVMLYPPPQVGVGSTGVKPGGFGFTLTGGTNQVIVIEASTNLATWQPIWTNTLAGVTTNFVDPQWVNHPHRFYRARSY